MDDGRGQRRQDRHDQHPQHAAAFFVVAAVEPAEDGGPLRHVGDHHDDPGQGRGNRADQDVAVLDVGEFVGQHTGQFALGHDAQNTLGDRDRGVLRVAARGERVRALVGNDVQLGHRQPGARGQGVHDAVELGRFGLADFAGAVHAEDDLVRKPITAEIHDDGEHEGDHQPPGAAEIIPDQQDQAGQGAEKKRGAEHGTSWAHEARCRMEITVRTARGRVNVGDPSPLSPVPESAVPRACGP